MKKSTGDRVYAIKDKIYTTQNNLITISKKIEEIIRDEYYSTFISCYIMKNTAVLISYYDKYSKYWTEYVKDVARHIKCNSHYDKLFKPKSPKELYAYICKKYSSTKLYDYVDTLLRWRG